VSDYPKGSLGETHGRLVYDAKKAYDAARESLDTQALYWKTYDLHRVVVLKEKATAAQATLLDYRTTLGWAMRLDDAKALDESSREIADLMDALTNLIIYLGRQ
jgi:hypothetical protein